MVPKAAQELEGLMARRRELSSILLNIDMYERWGNGSDDEMERVAADGHKYALEKDEILDRIEKTVARLRRDTPEAVAAWAKAHIELLEQCITRQKDDSTQVFVAKQERQQWEEVIGGSRTYVQENVYYVHLDRDLYQSLFGFDPWDTADQ